MTLVIPMIEGAAAVSSPYNQAGALIRGIKEGDLKQLPGIAGHVTTGTLDGFEAGGGVAIGQRLAESLSLQVGDTMSVLTAKGPQTPFGVAPRIKSYPVKAIFQIGMSEFDSSFVYMPLSEAQTFFGKDGEATVIEVFVQDPDHMDAIRSKLDAAVGRPMIMTDWRQRNKTFFDALNVERNVMFIILALIVLVAALNIISGLTMLVKDKGQDIAILRTMGATRGAILRIFLITGTSIGVAGTFAGLILGVLVASNIEHIRAFLNWALHANFFPSELYFLSHLPSRIEFTDVVAVVFMTIPAVGAGDALSVLAGRDARSGRGVAVRVMHTPALTITKVDRRYVQGETTLDILRAADLSIWPGQSVALVAPSGAGKSTLLHVAGLLEKPDAGEVFVNDAPTAAMDDAARTALRRTRIGFVYQAHHLLAEFSALENVMLPQLIRGLSRPKATERSMELLAYLGLGARTGHRPSELSGGEQQRVAIARAVANAPGILLADEPTGNLDPRTAEHVFSTLTNLVKATGLAALIATHNLDLAHRMDRRVTIQDGVVVELP